MEIENPKFDLKSKSIEYHAIHEGKRYLCSILPEQLCDDLMPSDIKVLDCFENRSKEIEKATIQAVANAIQRGIEHIPGIMNKPLLVVLNNHG